MLLSELLDLSKLQEHLNQGTVGVQQHPTLPLVIYNYTHRAQFTPRIFGDGVIDYCRGLIVHEESGEIIARPFKKFHNLNTADFPETNTDNIIARYSAKQMHTTEKMDGSLGIFWRYENDWGIATRGSFTSPQAVRPAYEGMYGKDNRAERKFYAEYIQRMTQLPWVTAVFWMMYDKRSHEDINELVWDAVKPRGNDQSFRRDGE